MAILTNVYKIRKKNKWPSAVKEKINYNIN